MGMAGFHYHGPTYLFAPFLSFAPSSMVQVAQKDLSCQCRARHRESRGEGEEALWCLSWCRFIKGGGADSGGSLLVASIGRSGSHHLITRPRGLLSSF